MDKKERSWKKNGDYEYTVQIGALKVHVTEDELEPLQQEKETDVKSAVKVTGSDKAVKPELDVRGRRFAEAMREVEKYLDDALLAGYPRVSIIHGKGTGALRQGVAKLLETHPHVKRMRPGKAGEGGSGVTVVELN